MHLMYTPSIIIIFCFVTCHIRAALSVERTLSQNDLVSDYSETVDVPFLGDPQHAQVFRGRPQVCQTEVFLKLLNNTHSCVKILQKRKRKMDYTQINRLVRTTDLCLVPG